VGKENRQFSQLIKIWNQKKKNVTICGVSKVVDTDSGVDLSS